MTIEAALHNWFNSFDIPAYPTINTPDDASYPYITYEYVSGMWLDHQFPTVNVWYKGAGFTALNAKVREIAGRLKNGGETIECDGGMLWINPGTPWSYVTADAVDDSVKRAILNINIEFLTN